ALPKHAQESYALLSKESARAGTAREPALPDSSRLGVPARPSPLGTSLWLDSARLPAKAATSGEPCCVRTESQDCWHRSGNECCAWQSPPALPVESDRGTAERYLLRAWGKCHPVRVFRSHVPTGEAPFPPGRWLCDRWRLCPAGLG